MEGKIERLPKRYCRAASCVACKKQKKDGPTDPNGPFSEKKIHSPSLNAGGIRGVHHFLEIIRAKGRLICLVRQSRIARVKTSRCLKNNFPGKIQKALALGILFALLPFGLRAAVIA